MKFVSDILWFISYRKVANDDRIILKDLKLDTCYQITEVSGFRLFLYIDRLILEETQSLYEIYAGADLTIFMRLRNEAYKFILFKLVWFSFIYWSDAFWIW